VVQTVRYLNMPGELWSCYLTQETWISVTELLSGARSVESTDSQGRILGITDVELFRI